LLAIRGIRMNKGVQLTLLLIFYLPLAIVSSGTLSEQNLSEENAQIVQQEYARLYQGDIPAMLDAMSENVVWIEPGASNVPFAGTYTGLNQVQEFLTKLYESIEFTQLDPSEFVSEGANVVVLGSYSARAKATGSDYTTDFAMVWAFQDGKIVKVQSFHDTAAEAAAFVPTEPPIDRWAI
jgi:ketosteroid isomerase-like protein